MKIFWDNMQVNRFLSESDLSDSVKDSIANDYEYGILTGDEIFKKYKNELDKINEKYK